MNNHLAPFEVRDAPLRQYCEVHFSGHDHYRSIELQRLVISPSRSGYVVLLNTNDGYMDVLSEPQLEIDENWCRNDPSVSSYRLGKIEPVTMDRVHLHTSSSGVDAHVTFHDSDGRRVEMTVRSPKNRPAKSRKLFIPAVPRASAKMLWFLYVFEFGPLRQSDQIDVSIDGESMKHKKWPWPVGLRRHVQGRYANDIVFVSLNPPVIGPVQAADKSNGYQCAPSDDDGQIPRIQYQQLQLDGDHVLTATFDPPISAVTPSGDSVAGKGSFQVDVDGIRISKGNYSVTPSTDSSDQPQTVVQLSNVDQWWRPPEKDISVWMLQFYHRLRTRGKRWQWTGTFRAGDDGVRCESDDWTLE
tara:strand:- start:129629 stop:130699 length:1071 start_codon:yes stop_codon:yes gene_type:complete